MTEFVELYLKRNRGWPWPEDSFGLTPMFDDDGWCHSCGTPLREQSGSLVLQRRGLRLDGAWVPNWRFDVICLEQALGEEVVSKFDVDLFPVEWRGASPGEASQIAVPTVGEAWFDEAELRRAAIARHGTAGARCAECGVWRWMPLNLGMLPPVRITPELGAVDIAASPEWFGDGWKSFRQILVRRELAELIAAAAPKDFEVEIIP